MLVLRCVFGKSMVAFVLHLWILDLFRVTRPWGLKCARRGREKKSWEVLFDEAMESESCTSVSEEESPDGFVCTLEKWRNLCPFQGSHKGKTQCVTQSHIRNPLLGSQLDFAITVRPTCHETKSFLPMSLLAELHHIDSAFQDIQFRFFL